MGSIRVEVLELDADGVVVAVLRSKVVAKKSIFYKGRAAHRSPLADFSLDRILSP
jgi:hypothetical protein